MPASFSLPSESSLLYTGINELDKDPSPKRFCSRLGIRKAAVNASAAGPRPRTERSKDSLSKPDKRESSIPRPIFFAPLFPEIAEDSLEDSNSLTSFLIEG